MATAAPAEPLAELAGLSEVLRQLVPGRPLTFAGADWATYQHLHRTRDEYWPGVRIAYHCGRLEIVSPLYWHDHCARSLAILVRGLAAEFGLKVKSAGSTTLSRERLDAGVEPDECFYIGHYAAVRGKRDLDFDHDPPPDLTVEAENTRTVLDRLPIYAALQVPEVWRYARAGVVEIRVLRSTGEYEPVAESPTFPGISPADLARFVERAIDLDDNELMDEFRAWVQQTRTTPPGP